MFVIITIIIIIIIIIIINIIIIIMMQLCTFICVLTLSHIYSCAGFIMPVSSSDPNLHMGDRKRNNSGTFWGLFFQALYAYLEYHDQ
ncbi:hypothetical protein DUNSADRAFT_14749 [Dunaliella salina]|uniref:Uncharacterized protein n=1 Tax=Dunaliella salina TaxID=3046 RepID=A0ABQ7G6S4_DUNSA|nr:hypothetical protein DUNSADRAFT_14749 [Dunaliella salina]|eukprot:KAF5830318.1 hypothetical protein DUNSADRAFT_14749 [Dunaliella salina]